MRHPIRPRIAVLVLVGALGLAACGGSSSDDTEQKGLEKRAVTSLEDYGLTEAQATCVTEALGAEVVVEAPDMAVLAGGQQYQDAAASCIK